MTRSSSTKTTPTSAARKAAKRAQTYSSSEDELQAATKRSMRVGLPVESTSHSMFDDSGPDLPSSENASSDSEEYQVTKPSASRKHRHRVDDSDDDEATVGVRPRTLQQRIQSAVEIPDEDEELTVPNKRRKTRHQRTSQHSSSLSSSGRPTRRRSTGDEEASEKANDNESDESAIEEEELREELALLTSTPPPDRGRLRSTQRKPMNKRQKALEALKKRRASANTISPATPICQRPVILESESDSDLKIVEEVSDIESNNADVDEDEIEDSDHEYDESISRVVDARTMFEEEQEDDDFIDDADDEETPIGEPAANADIDNMHLQNYLMTARTSELFAYAIEWMVMKKIHPEFDSKSDLYERTFRKLDNEVNTLVSSKYTSAVWTPEFRRAIQARPNLEINEISSAAKDVLSPHCEACNRSKMVASFEVALTGPPYDGNTLDTLQMDDSDSDSASSEAQETHSNGEKKAYDAQGNPLPPESRRFALGSNCKANAQIAHTLQHWRYHLYQWVIDYLAREGHFSPEQLKRRNRWRSNKKREKAAHKIMKRMEKDGEIKKLFRLFNDQVDFAVQAKNDFKLGWGRRW